MIVEPAVIEIPELRGKPAYRRVRDIPAKVEDGLFIQCRAVTPKSAEGKNVTLRITAETADEMLRALRDYGRDRRKHSLGGAD